MVKFWATGCLLALGALSTARAVCDDVDTFLNVPSLLTGDMTINLSVGVIQCEIMDPDTNPEEVTTIVVEGGTLTIQSDDTVQFINVAFLVFPGAALVFDMPETLFGPNGFVFEGDFPLGSLLAVTTGGSLTFNGDVTFREILHARNILDISGSAEFKKTCLSVDNRGGFRVTNGELRFRGDTNFRGNDFANIFNSDGGFVRFSTTVTFDGSSSSDPDGVGCVLTNDGADSKMSFRGDAFFINNNRCTSAEASPVTNSGEMIFYGKARFNDNTSGVNGGAIRNRLGSMTFRRAVQFNNNLAEFNGGAVAVEGGDVTFRRGVLFNGNTAEDSGGAFAVLFAERFRSDSGTVSTFGSLTFERPSAVRFVDNTIDATRGFYDDGNDCTVGEVVEGTTLIGFPGDDVCVAAM